MEAPMRVVSFGVVSMFALSAPATIAGEIIASAAPAPGSNGLYSIDPQTGGATLLSPAPLVSALAASPDGRILAWQSGTLVQVNPANGLVASVGNATGVTSTAFDVLDDGRAFIVGGAQSSAAQLYQVDTTTGAVTAIGAPGAINAGIDASLGLAPGTSRANVFSLGSVGSVLYGINGETGRTNLIRIDTTTADASVIGPANALVNANGGGWGGFASLTGVDLNLDGTHDALYGGVNFGPPGGSRVGVVARYDVTTGSWSQVGANAPLIFFGMASVPGVPCDSIDFNGDGLFPDDSDLIDFLSVLAGGSCSTDACADIDFNNDELFPDDTDLVSFLSVLAGGAC
jgi:hypothetical protein